MTPSPPPFIEREPEIEFLAKVVRVALVVLRVVSVIGGLLAVGAAIFTMVDPVPAYSENIPPLSTVIARETTFLCLGIPLLLPVAWIFGRGRWLALAIGAVLWFGPMLLLGDHDYGLLIRMFASLVAISVLAVWRALFALRQP